MRFRALLTVTGIVSSLLGALVVYLIMSVPNDLRADALLKQARKDMTAGQNEKARESLARIVQQYPRTDAAAAATVALVSLSDNERDELAAAVGLLRRQNDEQAKMLTDLQKAVLDLRKAPPKPATVTAPPKAPAKKKTVTRKPAPKKRTTRRTRRRG